jgi:hypothetical protein
MSYIYNFNACLSFRVFELKDYCFLGVFAFLKWFWELGI